MSPLPPKSSSTAKIRRQIQLSTPVAAPSPPHTPPIQRSVIERRSALTASIPGGGAGGPSSSLCFARSNSASESAPLARSASSLARSSAIVIGRAFASASDVEQQPRRILQRLLHRHQAEHRLAPVDDPVVVAQREVVHRPDHDLARLDHRPVLGSVVIAAHTAIGIENTSRTPLNTPARVFLTFIGKWLNNTSPNIVTYSMPELPEV